MADEPEIVVVEEEEEEEVIVDPESDEDGEGDGEDDDEGKKDDDDDGEGDKKGDDADDDDPTDKFFEANPEIKEEIDAASSYRELFPTLEEAKTAKLATQQLQATRDFFADANPEEHLTVLEEVGGKENGKKLIRNFAARFIPAIAKADHQVYSQLVHAMTQAQLMTVYNAGDEDAEDDELRSAAETVAKFLWKDKGFASGRRKLELPKVEEVQRASRGADPATQQAYQSNLKRSTNSVYSAGHKQAVRIIQKQMKAAGQKPGFATDALAEKILASANQAMSKNPVIFNSVKAAFAKLPNDDFSSEHVDNATKVYVAGLIKVLPKQIRRAGLGKKKPVDKGIQKSGTKSAKRGGGKSSRDWHKPGIYRDILAGSA